MFLSISRVVFQTSTPARVRSPPRPRPRPSRPRTPPPRRSVSIYLFIYSFLPVNLRRVCCPYPTRSTFMKSLDHLVQGPTHEPSSMESITLKCIRIVIFLKTYYAQTTKGSLNKQIKYIFWTFNTRPHLIPS